MSFQTFNSGPTIGTWCKDGFCMLSKNMLLEMMFLVSSIITLVTIIYDWILLMLSHVRFQMFCFDSTFLTYCRLTPSLPLFYLRLHHDVVPVLHMILIGKSRCEL